MRLNKKKKQKIRGEIKLKQDFKTVHNCVFSRVKTFLGVNDHNCGLIVHNFLQYQEIRNCDPN